MDWLFSTPLVPVTGLFILLMIQGVSIQVILSLSRKQVSLLEELLEKQNGGRSTE